MRRPYRICMDISGQEHDLSLSPPRGPRARMLKTMLAAAVKLTKSGKIPSVSEVAEAAEVSRATAYRYFPTQSALVQAIVNEALGPILEWRSDSDNAVARINELFAFAYPRMQSQETSLRASLAMALDERTKGQPTPKFRRTRRVLLRNALLPLQEKMSKSELDRLAHALSLVFGIESIVVLQDVWKLDGDRASRVALWAANALIHAAMAESGLSETNNFVQERSIGSASDQTPKIKLKKSEMQM